MLELEPDELDPDELEPEELEADGLGLEEPEPELVLEEPEPELVLGLLDGELPALAGLVVALVDDPGSASATAPAASTLATPTVAVVAVTRVLARWRAATARATASRFRLFMT